VIFLCRVSSVKMRGDYSWKILCTLRFPRKYDVGFVFTSMCFVGSSCFINVICIYLLVSNTIPFQMMFMSFNSNTTVSLVEQELITLPEHLSSAPVYSGVRIARSFVFFVVFCRSLLVLFLLTIVFSILRCKASDYPFDIFKLFF
jgi:hypothetical protein